MVIGSAYDIQTCKIISEKYQDDIDSEHYFCLSVLESLISYEDNVIFSCIQLEGAVAILPRKMYTMVDIKNCVQCISNCISKSWKMSIISARNMNEDIVLYRLYNFRRILAKINIYDIDTPSKRVK